MTYSEFASKYIGTLERTRAHKEIIDYYNAHTSGYNLTYHDAWCAAFVSYVWLNCGAANPPLECSCTRMRNKAIRANQYIPKTPTLNAAVLYDWDNDNVINHVGIISGIKGNTLSVIEGNYRDAVRVRTIRKDDKRIAGYIVVPHNGNATIPDTTLIDDIIKGKYGNGNKRKAAIEGMGYDYKQVQALVNQRFAQTIK